MKKRFLVLVLVLMFGFFLASCGDDEQPDPTVDPTVVDTVNPQILGVTNVTITLGDSFNALTGVTATDNIDGNLTSSIVVTGTYNASAVGVYTITYTVTDAAGNVATATRTLTVNAPAAPVLTSITFAGISDLTVAYESEFNVLAGITAMGNDGVDYTSSITYTSLSTITGGLLDTTKIQIHGIRYEVRIGTVVAQRWRYITVEAPVRPDDELVVNGDFATNTSFWDDAANGLYIADGAALTISHDEGALKAEVVAGSNIWTPRFGQQMIAFEQGKTYEVSFRAKSSVVKTINLQVGELISYAPWFIDFKPGQTEHIQIGTDWATYSFKFTMNLDNPRGGILFELGNVGGRIDATMWFDDIMVEESTLDPIVYEGYHFLDGWVENDLGTYAFSTVEGATVVDYTKGGNTYAFMRRNFLPEDAEGYNTLIMTLDGEAGKSVIVKPNDLGSLEKIVTFGDQPVTIMVTAESFTTVLIFAEGGVANVSGQFTISLAVLTFIEGEPEEPEWNGYNMTVTQTETDVTIEYANTPSEWWNHNAQLALVNFDGTKEEIKFTFTGVLGHEYLFKIEGGGQFKESPIVGTGTEQVLIMDLSSFTEAQRDAFILIVVFVQTLDAEGTLVLKNWEYVIPEPMWIGYGLTVLETETDVTITYGATPANWWENNAQLAVVNFNGMYDAISFTFTGVAGQTYLFKIEGGGQNKELFVLADGTEQVALMDLSSFTVAQRNAFSLIIVFVNTVGAEGSVVVKNWEYVMPEIVWIGYGLTVLETETDVTITYGATPANWWENNAQLTVVNFDGTKEEIKFTFTGVVGHEYLFKIEGGGQARELSLVADGTEQELILSLVTMTEAQRNALSLIIVFVKTPGAEGSVVVKNWEYVEGEAAAPVWMGYGLTVVQTETEVSITYANTPGAWWSNNAQLAIVDFDGTQEGILFTFTGVAGQTYVFKIEGNGQFREVEVVADGTLQELLIDLSTMTEAQRDGLVLIVIFSKTEGASGTLVVRNWEYPTV